MNELPEKVKIETDSPSAGIQEALKKLIPGALGVDGTIDAQVLSELSGLEVSGLRGGAERFGFMWSGRGDAINALQSPSMASIEPEMQNSTNWDLARNVFVEGDNLEVLKLLQKAYNDKVKLIYIDPPYNTGNDFVYNDDFSDTRKHYLEVTGQVDSDGNRLVANTELTGRKHSNWLTMMYPRLVLARNLLTDNGAICVSIDDNEFHQLRSIMDEIFGAENFIATLAWQSRPSMQNDTDISVNHEYIVCYARNRRQTNRRLKPSNASTWFTEPSCVVYPSLTDASRYKLDDKDGRGPYKEDPFDAPNVRPNLTYEIRNPNTGESFMPPSGRCWRTGEQEFLKLMEEGRISWGASGTGRPKQKSYLLEKEQFGEVPGTWLTSELVGSATAGTKELQKLFDGKAPFDTVKPTKLMIKLLELFTQEGDLVMDFFAGSGTMGHAVMELDIASANPRKFLLVNIDETIQNFNEEKHGSFKKVSDITKARLKLVLQNLGLDNSRGLRSYKLAKSNFVSLDNLSDDLFDRTLSEGASDDGIVSEILLKNGVTLDEPWIRSQSEDFSVVVAGRVGVILSKTTTEAVVDKALALGVQTIVFLEDSFKANDPVKTNAHFKFKQANITMKTV
jgi:adenine-specific DNA-methyltransferase